MKSSTSDAKRVFCDTFRHASIGFWNHNRLLAVLLLLFKLQLMMMMTIFGRSKVLMIHPVQMIRESCKLEGTLL